MNKKLKHSLLALIYAVVLVAIDRISKILAVKYLSGGNEVVIIKSVFTLRYLENRGAAFGMLQNKQILFVILTIVVMLIVVKVFLDLPDEKRFRPLAVIFVFLFAGALGNLIDRLMNGYVVDFFYFVLIDFPIFNMADIYVSVSVTVLIILMVFYYKEEDFSIIFKKESSDK